MTATALTPAPLTNLANELLDCLTEPDTVFSPHNISQALALVAAGASGPTRSRLDTLLGADGPRVIGERDQHLAALDGISIRGGVAAWFQSGLPLLPTYQQTISGQLHADHSKIDFRDRDQAAQIINTWIAGQTEGKITDLLDASAFDERTRLVLTSALYFCGAWPEPFERIGQQMFTTPEGLNMVEFMQADGYYRYAYDNDLVAVRLPYRGGRATLDLYSADDLDDCLARVERLHWRLGPMVLDTPLFSLRRKHQLGPVFSRLGLDFSVDSDLVGFTDEPLAVSQVLHEAVIDVDAHGTVAAAATGLVMAAMAMPAKPVHITIDRPFIAVVRAAEVPLFVARVSHPEAPKASTEQRHG
jgi:serine protease inhibitor